MPSRTAQDLARVSPNRYNDPDERFSIVANPGIDVEHFLKMDSYSAATAFVAGQFRVRGDVVAAVRFFTDGEHSAIQSFWHSLAARLGNGSDKTKAAREIQFHYDRSNEFYAQFLDSRMQYSAADFSDPRSSLDEAQVRKLDRLCRAMKLQPGERFLDIGCGWGGLIVHAAEHFGVQAVGCTLSRSQFDFATNLVMRKGLDDRISIKLKDYHDMYGRFDKIASIGMFEHVGRRHLPEYFERVHTLLEEDGLFLNRGIVRPEAVSDGPETLFLQRSVFPGGELEHLADVLRDAGSAGFEAEQMEDFRQDYGLTCRVWVERLQQQAEACCALVGEATYRTWLLYLAASSVGFENGTTDAVQILFRKSPAAKRT